MTTTTPTTTPEKETATGSSSSPGSTESKATASPTGVTDDAVWLKMINQMAKMTDEIGKMTDGMGKMEKRLDEKMDSMGNDLNVKMESMGNDLNVKMDSMGNDLNVKMESMGNDLNNKMESMGNDLNVKMDSMGNDLKDMRKDVTTLTNLTSYLVEEAARPHAAIEFPGELNRSCTIKSIQDVIDLILPKPNTGALPADDEIASNPEANASALPAVDPTASNPKANTSTSPAVDPTASNPKANNTMLPADDRIARVKELEGELVEFLSRLLLVFFEAALNEVVRVMDEEPVFKSEVFKDQKQEIRKIQEEQKAAAQAAAQAGTKPDMAISARRCYTVMGAVKELSTTPIDGESDTSKLAREKMNQRFWQKLERIKKSLEGELRGKDKRGLATSKGAGILMCNALAAAGRTVWEGGEIAMSDWIREKCIGEEHSIFDYKKEMECDVCPSVEIKTDNSVTLMVGEIKTNIKARKDATKQMQEQVRLLEFGLWFIFGDTIKAEKIVKKGYFYFLEAKANQGLENTVEDGLSITMHKIGHSNATESSGTTVG